MFKLPTNYIVLDLETNGLPDKSGLENVDVTEIGYIVVDDGQIIEQFQSLCKPVDKDGIQKPQPAKIIEHTGITDDMLKGCSTTIEVMEQCLPRLIDLTKDLYIIGHNIIGFDKQFIDKYCLACNFPLIKETKFLDTAALFKTYRRAHSAGHTNWNLPFDLDKFYKWGLSVLESSWTQDKVKYNVDAAIGYLAIPLFGISGDRHRAIYDCIVTSKIFDTLKKEMEL
jgi:DNA polymerase III epsilon subunit-like protein